MVSMDMKPIVYAILTLAVILVGAFLIIKFVPQANETFQDWISRKSDLLPHERESAQDKYKQYFEEKFLVDISKCRDSLKTECKCLKEDFNIPGQFSLVLSKKTNFVEFNLINDQKVDFIGSSYVVNKITPCLILEDGNFSFDSLVNSSILYKKEDNSQIEYAVDSETFQKEIDDSFIFYKLGHGKICIVEKTQINELNNTLC